MIAGPTFFAKNQAAYKMPPAARLTDLHTCPMVTVLVPHVGGPITGPGAPTVLIGGLPAAVVGDMCVCTGPPSTIVMGSPTVMIGGKPAARMGDPTAHGGVIAAGCPTVQIGGAVGALSPGAIAATGAMLDAATGRKKAHDAQADAAKAAGLPPPPDLSPEDKKALGV